MILRKKMHFYFYLKMKDNNEVTCYHISENKVIKRDNISIIHFKSYIDCYLKNIICYLEDPETFIKKYIRDNDVVLDHVILRHNNITYRIILQHEIHPRKEFILKNIKTFMPVNTEDTIEDILNTLIIFSTMLQEEYSFNMHQKNILTISTIGLRLFKRISPKEANKIKFLTEDQDSFIRNSFVGGRTEIYRPDVKNKLYYYDINSLFPYIMHNYSMPIGRPSLITDCIDINLETFFGFIDVDIVTNEIYLPRRTLK